MNEELLNQVRVLRTGSGVSAVTAYLLALYEETKERLVEAAPEQQPALTAEARLLKRLYDDFRREPSDTPIQRDGAYT